MPATTKPIRFILIACLLSALFGCSISPSPDHPTGQNQPQAPARLNSPVLSQAENLIRHHPDKTHIELLDVGYAALLARIHLIRSARHSIAIQTMIWENDETGRLVIYELIQAARRGVEVRLLIDHVASEHNLEIACFLATVHPNFQIRMFNPVVGVFGRLKINPSSLDKIWAIAFKFNRLNQRMHNKTFIIDNIIGITGGRNYQNAYYDKACGMNYKDRDVLAMGAVVNEMGRSFDEYWTFERSAPLQNLVDVKQHVHQNSGARWLTRDSFELNGLFSDIESDVVNQALLSELIIKPLQEVDSIYFIADKPYKKERFSSDKNHPGKITLDLARLISQATQSIAIQTPYLVLSSRAVDLFAGLREQHPDMEIRISTNSLAATDSWYVYALSYKQKKTYLSKLKFKIYEFKPLPKDIQTFVPGYEQLKMRATTTYLQTQINEPQNRRMAELESSGTEDYRQSSKRVKTPYLCLHAKSLVIDDEVSFVGSYNLDPRSENINTECGLIIQDKKFAQVLKNSIETDMKAQNSWVIAPKKRFAVIDQANAVFVELSRMIPLIDIWPFRYTASFELIDGRLAVATTHPNFYDNYQDVGSFPQVKTNAIGKEIGARGTKAVLSFVKPLL